MNHMFPPTETQLRAREIRERLFNGKPVRVEEVAEPVKVPAKVRSVPVDLLGGHSSQVIIKLVALKHNIPVEKLTGQKRYRQFVHARQEAMYLLSTHRPLSLFQIGKLFSGRDHTSVLYSVSAHERRAGLKRG